jgi:hypothetical protein
MSAEVTLLVRIGRDFIIPKYQPTKPTLGTDAVEEENDDGEISCCLVFLIKKLLGNRK